MELVSLASVDKQMANLSEKLWPIQLWNVEKNISSHAILPACWSFQCEQPDLSQVSICFGILVWVSLGLVPHLKRADVFFPNLMLMFQWRNLIIWTYFALRTDTPRREDGLLILTQHVKVFSIQAFTEVEKSFFFSDLKPVIFMWSRSRNYEILAQMEVGHFLMWILQGMDAQERHSRWLVNVDILQVLFPGEVETQGHCKGRHTREDVGPVKWFVQFGFFLRDVFPKNQRHHSVRSKEALKKMWKKADPSSGINKYSFTAMKPRTQPPKIWPINYVQVTISSAFWKQNCFAVDKAQFMLNT